MANTTTGDTASASTPPHRVPLPAPSHYEAIVTSSDDAIIAKTLEGIVLSWNPAAQRIFGYSATEMIGRPMTDIFPHDRLHEEVEILGRVSQGQKVNHFETIRLHKDGHPIHVSATISPITDQAGRIVGVSKIARDVTERVAADLQLALLHREARELASIVASSDDAIVSMAPDGTIRSWNPAAERIFGYTAAQVMGQQITAMFPPDPQDEAGSLLDKLHRGDRVHQFETERVHRDGHRVHLSVTLSPIRDEQGTLVGISGIGRDITERIQAEKRIWHDAHHDPLTDLPNRRLFMDRLTQEVARTQRYGRRFGLLFMDLDGFKAVNDTLGHDWGDALLQQAAQRITANLRTTDTLARLGGDEFVALLPETDSDAAVTVVANRIVVQMREAFTLHQQAVTISVSVGVALCPQDGCSADELLTRADHALYEAKRGGRNRFCIHGDSGAPA